MSGKTLISFDYAIKYLLRNKGDYDIIEGFISALFASKGYKPVKINALLDAESNRESKHLKRSIADLVVEDADGNKYIVEIERSFTPNFMHKACFNTSRIIIDSISGNQDYTTIKKVFHISLLYFATKNMDHAISHGQTIIHSIDTAHPMDVRIANQGCIMFEHRNIFPEYFFISVPMFNDVINQEIDEWLYVMKHSETKEDFKSPYMKKVDERLNMLKMNDQDRDEYLYYLKEATHSQDILTAARAEGEAKGIAKGIEKGRAEGEAKGIEKGIEKGAQQRTFEVAINMLRENIDIKTISLVTGLTSDDILKLKNKLLTHRTHKTLKSNERIKNKVAKV